MMNNANKLIFAIINLNYKLINNNNRYHYSHSTNIKNNKINYFFKTYLIWIKFKITFNKFK